MNLGDGKIDGLPRHVGNPGRIPHLRVPRGNGHVACGQRLAAEYQGVIKQAVTYRLRTNGQAGPVLRYQAAAAEAQRQDVGASESSSEPRRYPR